ncbi:MAG: hypothetical protein K5804_17940 [Microbacterium sp.]|uniref:phage baseplate protein n=1 Tax=Microbacterium sp. TaxID=51671 RepID=UPI002602D68A|nr:hypothetical protein [Microbacterium sp.]MCV0420127.1 hypothetical protein [Microbacterium sp.]
MIREFYAGQNTALSSPVAEEIGIGGFNLFARVSDSTAYETQAPTSVVEDGSYIGDHLINAPIKLNISGDVSDVFLNPPPLSQSASRLPTVGVITALAPGRTVSQAQRVARIINTATDRYRQMDTAIKNGRPVSDFAGNKAGTKSIREQFIDFIESVHYGKQLITISMPYRTHESMAVTSVTITRDNQRKALSFTLTAQKFRIAQTTFVELSQFYSKPSPAVASQVAGESDKGVQSPESGDGTAAPGRKEKSVLSAILG